MDHEQVVRTIFERFFNQGDASVVDELVVEAYDFHNGAPDAPRTRERFKEGIERVRRSIPDMHWEIGLVVASGDMIAVRSTLTGTHLGDFMGIPASGRRLSCGVADFYRFEGGRIVEHWDVVDTLALLLRSGAALPPDLVANADAWGLTTVQ